MNVDSANSNMSLPSVLQTNAVDENQSSRVESVIQEANNHSFVKGVNGFGKSKFVLAKKGTALAPNGALLWKVVWDAYADGTNRFCSFVRTCGGINAIENCRLYMGGKLISETRKVGQKINLENRFVPYDAQAEILDQKLYGNHQYFYATTGQLKLAPDVKHNNVGFRSPTNLSSATTECSVRIDQLFPVLKDTMLPSSLSSDIIIEIDWNGKWTEVMVESGATAFTDAQRVFSVERPRLHLDYISFADEVANALNETIMSPSGMTIPYRQQVLINAQMPTIVGDDTQQSQDVELGFAGRSVMKIYVQKNLSGLDNTLLRQSGSTGLLQEQLQLVVNNRNLYDREVNKVSEMYSYLTQTASAPAYLLPATYNQVGELATANLNMIDDGVLLPQFANTNTETTGVRGNLQGRDRWLGINLAKVRGDGNDTPENAIQVGQAPMVLRLQRNSGAGGTDEAGNSAETKSAVNLDIWVECVRALVLRNGVVDTINV